MVSSTTAERIGAELAAVLPAENRGWWKHRHLRWLNFYVFCTMLLSAANGYDGSMMTGLQSLEQWQTFMGHPTGAWLGFIIAIQSLSTFLIVCGRQKCLN